MWVGNVTSLTNGERSFYEHNIMPARESIWKYSGRLQMTISLFPWGLHNAHNLMYMYFVPNIKVGASESMIALIYQNIWSLQKAFSLCPWSLHYAQK